MEKTSQPLPLSCKLTFWYQHFVKGEDSFEDSLHPVANIDTVEQFWAYYQHFKRPTNLPVGSYIYLFKRNVKPVWEDPSNKQGGAFVLRFDRAKSNRMWEDILLGFVSAKADVYANLNGIRIKVKKDFAEIDFWVSTVDDDELL
jgi:translation initiation factor 4E